jgi:hypothetical protein
MYRLRPRFLARVLTVTATLPAFATIQAMVIVPADGLQAASARMFHGITSAPTPPVTPTFPVQQSQRLTPGSTLSVVSPDFYEGGSGVAAKAYVNGPAVFAPDLVRPFVGDAWAAASARTGQIRAQAHGSWFQQTRSLPRPSGGSFQLDSVSTFGGAGGGIGNTWTVEINRQALLTQGSDGSTSFNPLHFGITLEV